MFQILLVQKVILLLSKITIGVVYAVEFSHRSGRDLVNLAKKRTNIVPLIFDARKPLEYRFLVDKYFNKRIFLGWHGRCCICGCSAT